MAQFNTYENALELFRSVNCVGSFNNIFIAYKNTSAGPGSAFGAIGGMVQAMADSQSQNIFKNTDGFLFNQTDMGIGVFALKATKALLTYSPDKFEPDMSKFFFIRYEDIQALEVKNFNILEILWHLFPIRSSHIRSSVLQISAQTIRRRNKLT